MASWAEAWVGRRGAHCAALVEEVALAQLGVELHMPQLPEEADPQAHSALLESLAAEHGRRVRRPRDFDVALMLAVGRRAPGHHAGVAAMIGSRVHVLHRLPGHGAHLHDAGVLRRCGYEIDGWWRLGALEEAMR